MREFSIGCGSVSEDEVIDERIEIHISISGKVLCSLATESVCDIRMNDSIKLTEDSSQLRRLNYIIHHHRQDEAFSWRKQPSEKERIPHHLPKVDKDTMFRNARRITIGFNECAKTGIFLTLIIFDNSNEHRSTFFLNYIIQ